MAAMRLATGARTVLASWPNKAIKSRHSFSVRCRPSFAAKAQIRHHDWASELQLLSVGTLLLAPPALAEEAIKYDPSGGSDFIKNVSGVAYIGLVAYFLFRLFTKRAKRAKEERIASTPATPPPAPAAPTPEPQVTPLNTFIGAAQAGLLGFGLWIFSTKVQAALDGMSMPSGYTAQNISITVRTIIIGLTYLATFIFTANAVGLTGLTLQLLIWPESANDPTPSDDKRPTGPQLPKVGITSSTDEVRQAFEIAEQLGSQKRQSEKTE